MRNRGVLGALMVAALVLLAGLSAQCGSGQQARVTPTPTKTAKPTFTPTSVATRTPVPSPTPLPTLTPTPAKPTAMPQVETVVVQVSPLPSAMSSPTWTPRPPTATATRRPAATRTKTPTPRPTATPAPPFTGRIVRGYARCDGFAAVTGFVTHANKTAYAGVAVGVWSDVWDGQVVFSEGSGKFDVNLSGFSVGKYYVAVVQPETCQLPAAKACQVRSNVLEVTVTEKCSGTGANQVSEVSFVGP